MHICTEPPHIKDLQSFNPQFKALIWDMDGTIMDSEKLHIQATLEVLRKAGVDVNEQEVETPVLGQVDTLIHTYFDKKYPDFKMTVDSFIEKKDLLILDLAQGIEIIHPQIKELLNWTSSSPHKLALVTSSEKKLAISLLKKLKIIALFDIILTREDTPRNKPDPMPYETAFSLLQVTPDESIIFEDSKLGLESAIASKATVVQARWYD